MHEYDKSSKWLIQEHGDGILYLGGARNVRRWQALQAEVVQPRQLPDGLLEVFFQGSKGPNYFLLEIATYPEPRLLDQALDDLMLTYQKLRVLPELLTLVLHPKGQLRVPDHAHRGASDGVTQLGGRWRVVELWTVPAEPATGSPGTRTQRTSGKVLAPFARGG